MKSTLTPAVQKGSPTDATARHVRGLGSCSSSSVAGDASKMRESGDQGDGAHEIDMFITSPNPDVFRSTPDMLLELEKVTERSNAAKAGDSYETSTRQSTPGELPVTAVNTEVGPFLLTELNLETLTKAAENAAENSPEVDNQSTHHSEHSLSKEERRNAIEEHYKNLYLLESKCRQLAVKVAESFRRNQQMGLKPVSLSDEKFSQFTEAYSALLQLHWDFATHTQHPKSTLKQKKLIEEQNMLPRMWLHGIKDHLGTLTLYLPQTKEHLLSFWTDAYVLVTEMLEKLPTFTPIWLEILGDLSRYRMKVDDVESAQRWAEVAKYWFQRASDLDPDMGRYYHHMACITENREQAVRLMSQALSAQVPFAPAQQSLQVMQQELPTPQDAVSAFSRTLLDAQIGSWI